MPWTAPLRRGTGLAGQASGSRGRIEAVGEELEVARVLVETRGYNPPAVEVALNDDSCDSASQLTYQAPTDGIYQLRAGCYSDYTCSGTVANRSTP